MAIRAQPVKSVFQRMPRLVREVSAQTGKQVRLVIEGEATEVDKTVIERLADPLTHMIRNAIDHGLEIAGRPPRRRQARGGHGDALGRSTAAAASSSRWPTTAAASTARGCARRPIEKGLIAPDALLTDEETDNLIFLPGFSTASQVSDISGRGVGMDVVKPQHPGSGRPHLDQLHAGARLDRSASPCR